MFILCGALSALFGVHSIVALVQQRSLSFGVWTLAASRSELLVRVCVRAIFLDAEHHIVLTLGHSVSGWFQDEHTVALRSTLFGRWSAHYEYADEKRE
jgi:hypothetical protein